MASEHRKKNQREWARSHKPTPAQKLRHKLYQREWKKRRRLTDGIGKTYSQIKRDNDKKPPLWLLYPRKV